MKARSLMAAGALVAAAAGVAGCVAKPEPPIAATSAPASADTRFPPYPSPHPAYYIDPPPPGQRRCVDFREDMFGRRYCHAYVGS